MQDIYSFLDEQKDYVIEIQKNLVSRIGLGPENGGQGEAEKAEYVLGCVKDIGVDRVVRMDAPDDRVPGGERPNFAAIIDGQDRSRTFWIISHLDVVPSGDLAMWDSDPFQLRVENDLVFGRGVEDNHQAVVSSLLAAKGLRDSGKVPPFNLGLLFVSDEETGNEYGLKYVLDNHASYFSKEDLFLVPDFGTSDSAMLEVAEKSMLWMKISVSGVQTHASRPQNGRNSIVAAAHIIVQVSRLEAVFHQEDSLFSPPKSTFSPTKIEANVPNINTIPGSDVFYIDCRVLPDYDLNMVVAEIEKLASEIAEKHGVGVKCEPVHFEQAAPATDQNSEIVRRMQKAISEVYEISPQPQGVGGGTVAVYIRKLGYPAAVWSTLMHQAHQANERSSISNTINDAKVFVRALLA
ncbi:MAG: M20 family metallo-hydrolase [Thermodesulfobacteriota bacterium]